MLNLIGEDPRRKFAKGAAGIKEEVHEDIADEAMASLVERGKLFKDAIVATAAESAKFHRGRQQSLVLNGSLSKFFAISQQAPHQQ